MLALTFFQESNIFAAHDGLTGVFSPFHETQLCAAHGPLTSTMFTLKDISHVFAAWHIKLKVSALLFKPEIQFEEI